MTIFSVELFIVETQFEISKYLLSIYMILNIWAGYFGRYIQLVPKRKCKMKAWKGKPSIKNFYFMMKKIHRTVTPRPLGVLWNPIYITAFFCEKKIEVWKRVDLSPSFMKLFHKIDCFLYMCSFVYPVSLSNKYVKKWNCAQTLTHNWIARKRGQWKYLDSNS